MLKKIVMFVFILIVVVIVLIVAFVQFVYSSKTNTINNLPNYPGVDHFLRTNNTVQLPDGPEQHVFAFEYTDSSKNKEIFSFYDKYLTSHGWKEYNDSVGMKSYMKKLFGFPYMNLNLIDGGYQNTKPIRYSFIIGIDGF